MNISKDGKTLYFSDEEIDSETNGEKKVFVTKRINGQESHVKAEKRKNIGKHLEDSTKQQDFEIDDDEIFSFNSEMVLGVNSSDEKEEKTKTLPKNTEKSIHNRPKEIDENREFGHWEIDCVEGAKDSKKTYMTLLERLTKKYIVIEMIEHTNESIKQAIDSLEEKYGSNFKKIFKSMTTDNGHEFLNYDKIEISKYNKGERRTIVYYTDPYSSWQKGMNENCNGILRRFIPKGTDLNKVTSEKLEKILNKINGKPRKILGFISAEKRFNEEIKKIVA